MLAKASSSGFMFSYHRSVLRMLVAHALQKENQVETRASSLARPSFDLDVDICRHIECASCCRLKQNFERPLWNHE